MCFVRLSPAFDYPQLTEMERVCAARIVCDSLSGTDSGAVPWTRVNLLGLMASLLLAILRTNA